MVYKEYESNIETIEVYEKILSGYFERFPIGFWNGKNGKKRAIEIIRYLFLQELNLPLNEIARIASQQLFMDYQLGGMIQLFFNGSYNRALLEAFPEYFNTTNLLITRRTVWTKDKLIKALKYIIEEELQLDDEGIKATISLDFFRRNRLISGLKYFNYSPFEALDAVYPNRFKPWELKYCPTKYWTKATGRLATKWLIEEKLKWTDNQLKQDLRFSIFAKYGLSKMLIKVYGRNIYTCVIDCYPNRFKSWEFKKIPNNYWTSYANTKEAMDWLIRDKLNIELEDCIKQNILTPDVFKENHLTSLLKYHNNDIKGLLNFTYLKDLI